MAEPFSVQVDGIAHLDVAVMLARTGNDVRFVVPDPHDRIRVQDMLARAGSGSNLTLSANSVSDVDLVLSSRPHATAPTLSLDWTTGDGLCITQNPAGSVLIEDIGKGDTGRGARLADALDARYVSLPRNATPASEHFRAVLSVTLEHLMLAGASPSDIDEALVSVGFSIGPFEAQDLAGVDTALGARQATLTRLGKDPVLPLFARAVAEGRLGRKVGVGWYRYPGNGGKVEDPLIEDMAAEEAHFAGLSQTHPNAPELVARCLQALSEASEQVLQKVDIPQADLSSILEIATGCPPYLVLGDRS